MSNTFTKAQEKAIKHKDGPCMVLAGPGSGKTFTIVNRIMELRRTKVPGRDILVITFTRAAAEEMKERYKDMSGDESVSFGTFHSIFYSIVRWAYKIPSDAVLTKPMQIQLMRKASASVYIDWDEAKEDANEDDLIQKLLEDVARYKAYATNKDSFKAKSVSDANFFEIYENYESIKNESGKLDFDDMLLYCYKLFKDYPFALEKWQKRYKYILVDEFQDINQVQFEITKLLAMPENNLFVVGDDDQSIYGFRGSDPSILLGFEDSYKGAEKIILNENFRSTKRIITACDRVISHNKVRYDKNFSTRNKVGDFIKVREVNNEKEEALFVASKISDLKKSGKSYSDMAVLFRTNHYARDFLEYAVSLGIPVRTKEKIPTIYDHFAVKDVLSYLKLATPMGKRSDLLKVINRPVRYIKRSAFISDKVCFEDLRRFYEDKEYMLDRIDDLEGQIKVLSNIAPAGGINYIMKTIGYESFLVEYSKEKDVDFKDIIEKITALKERASSYDTIEEFFEGIEKFEEERKKMRSSDDSIEALQLLTMHGAKGLEFDQVFIVGANEGITPYKKAETIAEIEEERRIFYVGLSRAKENLCVTFVNNKSGKKNSPSRFVNELLFV